MTVDGFTATTEFAKKLELMINRCLGYYLKKTAKSFVPCVQHHEQSGIFLSSRTRLTTYNSMPKRTQFEGWIIRKVPSNS